jgi:hypothetical protein
VKIPVRSYITVFRGKLNGKEKQRLLEHGVLSPFSRDIARAAWVWPLTEGLQQQSPPIESLQKNRGISHIMHLSKFSNLFSNKAYLISSFSLVSPGKYLAVFLNVAPCGFIVFRRFEGKCLLYIRGNPSDTFSLSRYFFYPEDGGDTFFWNVGL